MKYLDLLKKRQNTPTHGTAKTALTTFYSKCSTQGRHFSGKQDLHKLVGEALAEVNRQGRPWPVRFFASLPAEDRERLRTLERDIDQAVLNNDAMALPGLLNEWRALLISRLN